MSNAVAEHSPESANAETSPAQLIAGDSLVLDEFLRRWDAMPDLKFAELIDGVVYMPPPTGIDHGSRELDVAFWLKHYAMRTPGCDVATNATTILLNNAPQPDVHLRILPECGGQTWVENGLLHGVPELTVEVCHSSTAYDLNQKLELYQSAGVLEYVAVLIREHEIRWHRLTGKQYQVVEIPPDGILKSQTFPGLWLQTKALLERDATEVLRVLEQGLETEEHRQFVEQLHQAKQN